MRRTATNVTTVLIVASRTDLSRGSLIPRTYVIRSNLARSFVRSPVIYAGASARRFRNYEAIAREICQSVERNTVWCINDTL